MLSNKCLKCNYLLNFNEDIDEHHKKCIYYRYSQLNIAEIDSNTIDNIILISNLLLLKPTSYFISKNNILINLNLRIKLNKKNTNLILAIYPIVESMKDDIIEYKEIVLIISKLIIAPITSIIALNNLFYTII